MRKWKSFPCWFWPTNILLVFLLPLLFCFSCCGLTKTKTITETTIKVDTIIKIVTDTVLKTVSVPIYDTAFIETEKVIAKSFFNVKTQKIDLQLKGKVFEIPVKLSKTTFIKQVEKENTFSSSFWLIFVFAGAIILFLCYHLIKRI